MPTIAVKASVLDGRAEVVAYTRDSSKFFLRVRVPEKAGYKSRRIDGVETLDAAANMSIHSLGSQSLAGLNGVWVKLQRI